MCRGRDWFAQHFACLPFVALYLTSTASKTPRAALHLLRSFSDHFHCAFALVFAVPNVCVEGAFLHRLCCALRALVLGNFG